MNAADLSIVIPTLNGASTLPALLEAIASQETDLAVETVAVDSGSRDGTPGLLERAGVRVIPIPPEEFDHGLTRNLGVETARGRLVVMTVQDAVPASPHWLREITAPFVDDDRLAGVFCRQLPRPGASRLARRSLAGWIASRAEGRTAAIDDPARLEELSPIEQHDLCAFDNVCSCLRRSVWRRHPFRSTPIAEDIVWAKEVLRAGHRIRYVADAAVVHSHDRPARHEFARTRVLHAVLRETFDLRLIPTVPALLRAFPITMRDHVACLLRGEGPRPGLAEWCRAMGLAFAWPLGQYLGGRDGGGD